MAVLARVARVRTCAGGGVECFFNVGSGTEQREQPEREEQLSHFYLSFSTLA
jgi:hypothetical protein